MAQASFDVAAWLARKPGSSCGAMHVSQPVQLAWWTKAGGGGGVRYGDASGLLPYAPPPLPAPLEGPYVPKPPGQDVGVEAVLRAAAAAAGGAPLAACDVLTFRNNLNKIFGTPFDPRAAWTVDACLLPAPPADASAAEQGGGSRASGGGTPGTSTASGVLFLDIVPQPDAWQGDAAEQEKFVRWGYRFEALCTGQAVADATSEFGVLVRARVGAQRLLLGAEVDCFDPGRGGAAPAPGSSSGSGSGEAAGSAAQQAAGGAPPLGSLVELKTYRLPVHAGQQRSLHRWKHPKWWLQSFLAGVERLALGGRDEQGTLRRIDLVATADLPRISARAGAAWSPHQALRFGADALAWMRHQAALRPGQHLRFEYAGSGGGGSGGGGAAPPPAITCSAVEGGQLPQRLQRCLAECGLA